MSSLRIHGGSIVLCFRVGAAVALAPIRYGFRHAGFRVIHRVGPDVVWRFVAQFHSLRRGNVAVANIVLDPLDKELESRGYSSCVLHPWTFS